MALRSPSAGPDVFVNPSLPAPRPRRRSLPRNCHQRPLGDVLAARGGHYQFHQADGRVPADTLPWLPANGWRNARRSSRRTAGTSTSSLATGSSLSGTTMSAWGRRWTKRIRPCACYRPRPSCFPLCDTSGRRDVRRGVGRRRGEDLRQRSALRFRMEKLAGSLREPRCSASRPGSAYPPR